MAISINQGTQTAINTQTLGTAEAQVVRLDMGSGTNAAAFTGTIKEIQNITTGTLSVLNYLTNLTKGTVTRIEGGTIVANGTMVNNGGTVIADTYTFRQANAWGTVVNTGTNTMGTVKAGIAGSTIYVTDLIVSVGSATNVEFGIGGTDKPLIGTLYMNPMGGAVMNFKQSLAVTAGSALVYKQSTGGPMSITAGGYII